MIYNFDILRYLETGNLEYARHLETKDTILLVKAMVKSNNINKLNLRNKQRKIIEAFIRDRIDEQSKRSAAWISECLNNRKEWKGLLHHIHFKPKTTAETIFCSMVRGNYTDSRNSMVLKMIRDENITTNELISRLKPQEIIRFKTEIIKARPAQYDFIQKYIKEISNKNAA